MKVKVPLIKVVAFGPSPFKGMLKLGGKTAPMNAIQKTQVKLQPGKIYNTTAIRPVNTKIPESTKILRDNNRKLSAFSRRQRNINKKAAYINNQIENKVPNKPKYKPLGPKPL